MMRLCFGLAACYDARTDYCKGCEKKVDCAASVKAMVERIDKAESEKVAIQVAEADSVKEQFAERLGELAKHPRKLVEALISHGMYVKSDILRAGQRQVGKKVFWSAVTQLRQVGQFERAELLAFGMSEGMTLNSANSEATAVIKALTFYDLISKHGKQYRLKS